MSRHCRCYLHYRAPMSNPPALCNCECAYHEGDPEMSLTDWMLKHLPPELVDENNYYGLAAHISDLLARAWDEGAATPRMVDGSELPIEDNPYRRQA